MLELSPFYLEVIGITVAGLICYISIAFMLSKLLNRPQLTAYANVELNQLVISVVILVAAIAIVGFADTFSNSISGAAPGKTSLDVATDFTSLVLNKGVVPTYLRLMRMDVSLNYFNAVEIRMGPGVWSWVTKVVPGLDPLISITRMLVFTLTALYGTLSIQIIIFQAIGAVMYTYVLPAGIILRFLPPTRDAGVYLIVMAIAFQCFFPMLYAINYAALNDMWVLHGWGDGYDPSASNYGYFDTITSASWKLLSDFSYLTSWLPIIKPFNYIFFLPFFEQVAQISFVGMFLPALSMGLTVAFINAVTKFITGKG